MDQSTPLMPAEPGAEQPESGTKRSFGNMLNQDIKPFAPRKYMKHAKATKSPWLGMKGKKAKEAV
jgi:hypothetical protein